MDQRKDLGSQSEAYVAAYLNQQGITLEKQNWRGLSGEIDLIYLHNHTLVFVEVRSVQSTWLDRVSSAVSPKKQRQVARCADEYIRKRSQSLPTYQGIRFDVAGVLCTPTDHQLDYVEDAFESPWAF
jgi:putative endonuclease